MKPNPLLILLALLALASCREYIDEVQDNRTLIDSEDKAAKLLVNAYPDAQYAAFAEAMSDNADDKGVDNGSQGALINAHAYKWEDYESFTDTDSPSNFWTSCYGAIAQANQALASLEQLGSKTERASALRGEALLARAHAHFLLVNLFSLRYDSATASSVPGIPYVLQPEQHAIVQYKRETLAETYRLIEKDLTEGLRLVRYADQQAKYHFSPLSAHAFAARFYLYKGNWDKVIEHASAVFGDAPPALLVRDMVSVSYDDLTYAERTYAYSSVTERSNLLLNWTRSLVSRSFVQCRYGLSASKAAELFFGSNPFKKQWAYSFFGTDLYYRLPKYEEYFRILNVSAGTGYAYAVFVEFTADEALLNRAEAYAMLNNFNAASADLTSFLSRKTKGFNASTDKITPDLMRKTYPSTEGEYTPPYALSDEQTPYIKGIAEIRRREFYHEGLRWFDVKRFNLKVVHNIKNRGSIELPKDDLRRAIQIPEGAKAFGIEANRR